MIFAEAKSRLIEGVSLDCDRRERGDVLSWIVLFISSGEKCTGFKHSIDTYVISLSLISME